MIAIHIPTFSAHRGALLIKFVAEVCAKPSFSIFPYSSSPNLP
jgi:hypothetical protein